MTGAEVWAETKRYSRRPVGEREVKVRTRRRTSNLNERTGKERDRIRGNHVNTHKTERSGEIYRNGVVRGFSSFFCSFEMVYQTRFVEIQSGAERVR